MAEPDVVLAVRGVTKRFGGTVALNGADMTVRRGEIHALLGANGAGKSTLIKILAGLFSADSGEIFLAGRPLAAEPDRRISLVHQDLALIDMMSVSENMALGFGYPRRAGLIDWGEVDRRAAQAFARLGCVLPLHRRVAQLTQAERSIVAIARALTDTVDLLVLDEPTASLPGADVARLFHVLDRLRAEGVSILYVTHRLDEVFRIADAATVFRDGRTVAAHRPIILSSDRLVEDIVGRAAARHLAHARPTSGETVMRIEALCAGGAGPVSFTLGHGEIVGLAGLRGQGQEAVGRAVAGIVPLDSGAIALGSRTVRFGSAADALTAGVAFVSGRRAEEGLAATMNVRENLFLNPLNSGRRRLDFKLPRAESTAARAVLARFGVRPTDPEREITTLSGGNQQKVMLARCAAGGYRVLVLEDPTVGVDFGAKMDIYRLLSDDAAAGAACLVISSDLDELLQFCHRVLVFDRGRIGTELPRELMTLDSLTRAVSGAGALA